jgi:kynurenine formamidase
MTPMTLTLWQRLAAARVYDLAQPLSMRIPVSPNHPGFKIALMRRHGDHVRADGGSAANEMIMLGGHTGTHIDAFCHVSQDGRLHGGHDAMAAACGGLFQVHGVETIAPLLCRGVFLDVAALHGVATLPGGTAITAEDLAACEARQGVRVQEGDAVLIGSGWSAHWSEPETYRGHASGVPGPDESAGRWLAERRIRLAGGESIAFEHIPPGRGHALLPVHRIFLVEHGIYIVESLNLAELARDRVAEFAFLVAPLKVEGATGFPVRPLALVETS